MADDNNGVDIEAGDDNEIAAGRGLGGRQYRPVFAHDSDRAVLEMSAIDPTARASSSASLSNSNDLKLVSFDLILNVWIRIVSVCCVFLPACWVAEAGPI